MVTVTKYMNKKCNYIYLPSYYITAKKNLFIVNRIISYNKLLFLSTIRNHEYYNFATIYSSKTLELDFLA